MFLFTYLVLNRSYLTSFDRVQFPPLSHEDVMSEGCDPNYFKRPPQRTHSLCRTWLVTLPTSTKRFCFSFLFFGGFGAIMESGNDLNGAGMKMIFRTSVSGNDSPFKVVSLGSRIYFASCIVLLKFLQIEIIK